MPSFDIVIETDLQEVDNALNQARKEVSQRFDFRGSNAQIDWEKGNGEITLLAEEDRLEPLLDVVKGKLIKRGVSVRNLEVGTRTPAADGMFRQTISLQMEIPKETAKEIVKAIKQSKMKVQGQIQEGQVRVSGKKRDDLQAVIAVVKGGDFGHDFRYTNFRD